MKPLEAKDPDAVADYNVDWARHLDGDTISASEWTVPDGITADDDEFSNSIATVWLSGGTAGQRYSLTNRIETAAGRTLEQTIKVSVKER